jgi:Glycosyl hydrolases family 2, sugar binding domain/Glycosyl hydrolases family 2/Glycosyl hydrolases family 2, TIM barrel domain
MRLAVCLLLLVVMSPPLRCGVAAAAETRSSMDDAERGAAFFPDVFSYRDSCRPQIDLNGAWEFRRDPEGQGNEAGWHRGDGAFDDTMIVPGAPQAQGYGEPHATQRTAFDEPFWVRRRFRVPSLKPDERLWLRLGAVLPAAEVYVNGERVGYTRSSRTQQRMDITPFARPDDENLIAVKVCDWPEVRLDGLLEWNEGTAHWTGLYRPVYCEIANRIAILDAYVQPDLGASSVRVEVTPTGAPDEPLRLVLAVKDGERDLGRTTVGIAEGQREVMGEVSLASFIPWSPSQPKLYTLDLSLFREDECVDKARIRFGMREIEAKGTKLYLNGDPLFLRVYGEDHYYPDTLCPPEDIDWYLPRLKLARQYGFNAVKGCVETIPQDYLEAADEAGILVIQEMPFGLSTLRQNRHVIGEEFRNFYSEELDGLVRVSRNHASIVAYSMSSELNYHDQTQESFRFFSQELPRQTRALAPHALVIDCTGINVDTEQTEKGKRDTDFYAQVHPKWRKEVLDEVDMNTDGLHPVILHEYNWWSCYPDPADAAKYEHAQLKPFWFDMLTATARENGQADLLPVYRENSLWLQALCRKDGIEYARRNAGVEGYILWLLIDFGVWSEGLLDDFWNPRNVTPEELLKSNGDTVVLLGEEGTRCFPMGGEVHIPLAVSHYGTREYGGAQIAWSVDSGRFHCEGTVETPALVKGEMTQAGDAVFEVPAVASAYKFKLEVSLRHGRETVNTNEWFFWAFPEAGDVYQDPSPDGVFPRIREAREAPIPEGSPLVLADAVDEHLCDYVARGGRCVLFSQGAVIENTRPGHGMFRTIPWNRGDSGNSGTVISRHPALDAFPHEGMCDLPFLPMLCAGKPMEFEPLRQYGVTPIIRGIGHYKTNRNNAYLLEFGVGEGKVVVTSLGILDQLDQHIQARHFLKCLVEYAMGVEFTPGAQVPRDEFLILFQTREADGA